MKRFPFLFLFFGLVISLQCLHGQGKYGKQDLTGSWLGRLDAGGISLRIIFNIKLHGTDSLTATMDSPDQGAKNIPMGTVIFTDDTLTIFAPLIGGNYKGALENDSTVAGAWTQSGRSFSLVLKKQIIPFQIRRPQEPKAPYPYRSEEVIFPNNNSNINLAGTLTLPEGKGPFPAVILISGSGAQNRDEALMGHKPFLVIADWLTRKGIAVLRYDDRGVGKSQGNYATATSADLATDTEAALLFLLGNPAINKKAIGLMGHSEGGLIAPIVAAENKVTAFIVSLAGPGVNGEEIILRQQLDLGKASDIGEGLLKEGIEINKKLFEIIKNEPDNLKAEEKVIETYRKILTDQKKSEAEIEAGIKSIKTSLPASSYTWMRYFLITDPSQFWSKVRCPVLALNGDRDLQVAADINLPAIESALKAGRNRNIKMIKLEGLNHLFQHCTTGLPAEYGQIEETFSPEALNIISDWINGLKVSR